MAFAQDLKTETIAVAGNCGMCKNNIEKAAKTAGASEATWDMDKKLVTVSYNTSATTTTKIEKGIAAAGYDTKNVKATDAAYKKLHACCQYERTGSDNNVTSSVPAKAAVAGTSAKEAGCCAPTASCCKKETSQSTATTKKSCCDEKH